MRIRRPITALRVVGIAEGASFLALLFAAMPLKYLAGLPIFVQIVGAIHGGLFLLYVAAALYAFRAHRWSYGKLATTLAASLLPAGPFFIDRRLRDEARATEPLSDRRIAPREDPAPVDIQ